MSEVEEKINIGGVEFNVKDLASQLRCPNGELGVNVAKGMNQTNISMTRKAIDSLNLQSQDLVLEIGHGNCTHLNEILLKAKNIKYYGLDISELMKHESEKINEELVKNNIASYFLYDGLKIPFEDNKFNKIMTVNTLYFWKEPIELLKEIYRVLKPTGLCCIAFSQKKYMETLPVVKYGFETYDTQKVKSLTFKTDFKIQEIVDVSEDFIINDNQKKSRDFSVLILSK